MDLLAENPLSRLLRRTGADLATFPRQFWLLAVGMMVLLAGVDMCFPFETTYLTTRLGASMTTVGLLLGVPLLAALPLHIVGGALTDRYGRRLPLATGVCMLIGLYWTFAFASELWQIGIAIVVEAAFGWALFLTASNAMVADLVAHERRAEAYSITRVALNLGMIGGPLLGGMLIAADPTYRTLFITGGAVCTGFVAIVLLFFRETRPAVAQRHGGFVETLAGYAVVLRDRRFLAFCGIALLPLYGFGQIWSIFPVALRQQHGIAPGTWSVLLASYALTSAVFQYPVVRFFRRRNHVLLMAAASAFVGVGLATAVLAPWGVATFAAVFVLAQGVLLLVPISATISAELAPVALRGRYMGAWTLVQMGGYALGPTFGGWALDGLGARGAFALVGAWGLLGAALFAAGAGRLRPPGSGRAPAAPLDETVEDTTVLAPPGI